MQKENNTKEEWAAFIQTGSEQAFNGLYNYYFHYLNYIGLKKGFSSIKAKDGINDLFLYLWENRSRLAHTINHHNYIITSFLRKLYRKEPFSAEESLEPEQFRDLAISPSAETLHILRASSAQADKVLHNYVAQLPDRQRGMVYQKFYLGLSYKEIAEANDVSINTVYNTVYNAVDKLRALIGKDNLDALSIILVPLAILFSFFSQNQ